MKTNPRLTSFLLSCLSVFGVLVVLAVLVVLDVLPSEAQLPRPQQQPYNTAQLKHYVGTAAFPWTLTVCKGAPYAGDHADLSDALQDINKAFDLMHAGESIRSVVVY